MTTTIATLTATLKDQIRQQARELYARDGELEVDANAPIQLKDDGNTAKVGCWVWVTNDDADIAANDHHSDAEREALYLSAATDVITPAEFEDDIKVSLGDDDGSYVFGWVYFGIEFAGGELVPLPGDDE